MGVIDNLISVHFDAYCFGLTIDRVTGNYSSQRIFLSYEL